MQVACFGLDRRDIGKHTVHYTVLDNIGHQLMTPEDQEMIIQDDMFFANLFRPIPELIIEKPSNIQFIIRIDDEALFVVNTLHFR